MTWLQSEGWEIVCYDFPQSGTGVCLQPNDPVAASKNKNAVIPDIVAVRNGIAVFFENKSEFCVADFDKLHQLKVGGAYSESINELLQGYEVEAIHFVIGLWQTPGNSKKARAKEGLVDAVLLVDEKGEVDVPYDSAACFVRMKDLLE